MAYASSWRFIRLQVIMAIYDTPDFKGSSATIVQIERPISVYGPTALHMINSIACVYIK
jgi:hypothetical protein